MSGVLRRFELAPLLDPVVVRRTVAGRSPKYTRNLWRRGVSLYERRLHHTTSVRIPVSCAFQVLPFQSVQQVTEVVPSSRILSS